MEKPKVTRTPWREPIEPDKTEEIPLSCMQQTINDDREASYWFGNGNLDDEELSDEQAYVLITHVISHLNLYTTYDPSLN